VRIFISYASAYQDTAESIAIRLRQDGHEVFFDRHSLRAAEEFDAGIRREVENADLFLFLVAPEAVRAGAYTLTELGFAQRRWPKPSGRILPVMLKPTPIDTIPPYARAVTILQARGNLVAEVAARVAEMIGARRRRRLPYLVAATVLVLLVVLGYPALQRYLAQDDNAGTCYLWLQFGTGPWEALTVRISGGGISRDFATGWNGRADIHVTAEQLPQWELVVIDQDGRTLGKLAQSGCPQAISAHALTNTLQLELGPRDALP
jgi:hypothetical protein